MFFSLKLCHFLCVVFCAQYGKKGLKLAVTRQSKQSILVLLCCGGNLLTMSWFFFFWRSISYIRIHETFILGINLQKSSFSFLIYSSCLCPNFPFCFFTTSRTWISIELDCNNTDTKYNLSAFKGNFLIHILSLHCPRKWWGTIILYLVNNNKFSIQ